MKITDNIFRRKFTAKELYEWFNETFPDGFSMGIYEQKECERAAVPDYNKQVWNIYDDYKSRKKNLIEYTIWDRAIFDVYSGDENSYITFGIESDKDAFIVSWGYKRYDVSENYMKHLVNLIMETVEGFKGGNVYGRDYSYNKSYYSQLQKNKS